ncbi:MAG: helix-turn-helix domain-containing protein [Elusimicrobiales bacterium]
MIDIGKRISYLRRKNSMTLSELARASGLSVSMISQVERNIITPSVSTLFVLSKIFGVKPSYFLEEEIDEIFIIRKSNENVFLRKIFAMEVSENLFVYEINLKEKDKKNINIGPLKGFSFVFYFVKGVYSFEFRKEKYSVSEGDAVFLRENDKSVIINCEKEGKIVLIRFKNNI